MNAEIDVKHFPQAGAVAQLIPVTNNAIKRSTRPIVDEAFLNGPIAISWLSTVCKLGKPAIKTSLALWYISGLCKGRLEFRFNQSRCEAFGLTRFDVRKGLKQLEAAGLIAIPRAVRGSKFTIRLLKSGRRGELR
jgi:hypothetical protein